MKVEEEEKVYDDINITPMLDVAYVLLLIFIIMTTATVQGIYLDTYPVSIQELETRLGQYKAATPDLPVVVKADASVQYQKVIEVLDVVTRLEISQLGLVTQKLVK
jgi:biopolymer transport protein ExbD